MFWRRIRSLDQKYGGGVGWLSIVRLVEQEINKSFMGMGKRGEQMIKPKIIFCINQAAGRKKRGRIDLKLQEAVFVLTSCGKRRPHSPEE